MHGVILCTPKCLLYNGGVLVLKQYTTRQVASPYTAVQPKHNASLAHTCTIMRGEITH